MEYGKHKKNNKYLSSIFLFPTLIKFNEVLYADLIVIFM